MAITRKNLGQLSPSAATLTDIYTVPALTTAHVLTIQVANRSSTVTSFRIAHAVAGAADDVKQFLYYDVAIGGNDSLQVATFIPMQTTDVLRVYATLATLSFGIWGEEIT